MINERTKRLREKMEKRKATICAQRAVLYTRSFQQTEGEPYILRKAKAFAYTLEHMTIYIEPDSLIFGNQASHNFAAPIFPEYSIQWVIDELDTFEKRSGDILLHLIGRDIHMKIASMLISPILYEWLKNKAFFIAVVFR